MVQPLGQADAIEQAVSPFDDGESIVGSIRQAGHQDIFQHRALRQQMMILKHEADMTIAKAGQVTVAERERILAVQAAWRTDASPTRPSILFGVTPVLSAGNSYSRMPTRRQRRQATVRQPAQSSENAKGTVLQRELEPVGWALKAPFSGFRRAPSGASIRRLCRAFKPSRSHPGK
jgi:hypothetical protein